MNKGGERFQMFKHVRIAKFYSNYAKQLQEENKLYQKTPQINQSYIMIDQYMHNALPM